MSSESVSSIIYIKNEDYSYHPYNIYVDEEDNSYYYIYNNKKIRLDSYQRISYHNPSECKNIHELQNMLIQGWDTYKIYTHVKNNNSVINNNNKDNKDNKDNNNTVKCYTLVDIEDNYIIIRDDTDQPKIDVIKKPIGDFLRELHTGYSKTTREDKSVDFTRFFFKGHFFEKESRKVQPEATVSFLGA